MHKLHISTSATKFNVKEKEFKGSVHSKREKKGRC